jgi:hypothetical protein
MTLHEYLKGDNQNISDLIKQGVVSASVLRDIELMDYYVRRRDISATHYELIAECAKRYRITVQAVYRVVKRYSAEIKTS